MKLSDIDISKMIPAFMRDDDFNLALAGVLGSQVQYQAGRIDLAQIWSVIDLLPEDILDELAKELDVSWFLYDADIEKKREIIKRADEIHRHLGTKWAVEEVVKIYFGTGTVIEWWEDGFPFEENELPDGRLPYWFAVQTPPEGMDPELVDPFWEVIEKVKNVRSHIAFVYLNVPIEAKVIARGYVCATRATDAYTCSDTVRCSASLYASGAFDDDECENVFGPEAPEPTPPGPEPPTPTELFQMTVATWEGSTQSTDAYRIGGVTVTATVDGVDYSGTTAINGFTSFYVPRTESLDVQISGEGYLTHTESGLPITPPSPYYSWVIEIKAFGTFSCFCKIGSTGKPSGATVTLTNTDAGNTSYTYSGTTDENGKCQIENVLSGNYHITVSAVWGGVDYSAAVDRKFNCGKAGNPASVGYITLTQGTL